MSGHADTVRTVGTAEAAYTLGISERTVSRWVEKGKLHGELEDGVLMVHLESAPAVSLADTNGQVTAHADSRGQGAATPADMRGHIDLEAMLSLSDRMQESLALVDRLQRENTELAGRVGFLQAKLQDAEQQIKMLAAPKEPEPEPARPSLWRRMLGLSPA